MKTLYTMITTDTLQAMLKLIFFPIVFEHGNVR